MFNSFLRFKEEIKRVFEIVNEKSAAAQKVSIIWQNGLTVRYTVKFQRVVILMKWDDNVLNYQFYWELKNVIKNEIIRSDRSEELQDIINMMINIDNHMWKKQQKRKESWFEEFEFRYMSNRTYIKSS